MGGKIGRPDSTAMCLPERIIRMKVSSVHAPVPVTESGVRLMGKETPQGPTQVVRSCVHIAHFPGATSALSIGGNGAPAGCPDKRRVVSSTGPMAVKILGEWQSLQPPIVTRYLPRTTGSSFAAGVLAG